MPATSGQPGAAPRSACVPPRETGAKGKRPIGLALYTVREQFASDPATVLRRLAEAGITAVEPVCPAGLPEDVRKMLAGVTVDAQALKPMLDYYGLTVCSAHTALPEAGNTQAVFDEQELLGNDTLIVSAFNVIPGARLDDLNTLDTLKRTANRFNEAAALAADRGMRVGYHNHFWEWNAVIDGRPGYDVFWDHLDPSVLAEVDIYWAQLAGRDPAKVISELGSRAQLAHVKDGPVAEGQPMTPIGRGQVDVAAALSAGDPLRWHIIELDDCATDILDAVTDSARWLIEHGLSSSSSQER